MPAGITLAPGRLTVEFDKPPQALQKLIALAKAISNDFEEFERRSEPRAKGRGKSRSPDTRALNDKRCQ